MKKLIKAVAGVVVSAGLLTAGWVIAGDDAAQNTAPVGQVCKQGEPCAAAVTSAAGSGAAKSGEDVFKSSCTTCHSTGAVGAPKLGDAAAWAPRLSERGKDGLHNSAIHGFKGMPPKGLCMACSDDELKAAVDYMLDHSK